MERVGRTSTRIVAGLFLFAGYATPQAYTISAKPGAVNYVEGTAYLNGTRLSEKANRATFLTANDTLSTDAGKAEVLLSPGVFLRIGDDTQVRMISPSLVNTQLEVMRGEAMIEVSGLVKDNTVQVADHGGSITIERDGLYRINANDPPRIAVLDGRAAVSFGSREANLSKGREIVLSDLLKPQKFDTKQPDDLYAWSNIRSEYNSAASYQTASNISSNSFGGWGGYGFGGWSSPGWYWANGFDSYAWLPGAGAYYSPFGYGFYAPGAVAYAPVVVTPIYRGGGVANGVNGNHGPWNGHGNSHWNRRNGLTAAVPLNPNSPAAVGTVSASPFANSAARAQAAQSYAFGGFHTGTGAPVASFSGSRVTGFSGGGHVGVASAGGGGGHAGGGGWSGGGGHAASSGGAMSAGGGGHAGGGAGGGGGHR